jgi:hypothetical protein
MQGVDRFLSCSGQVLLVLATAAVQAADLCDPSLEPINSRLGYQPRDAMRCEGLYVSNVSAARGLDLVGLTRGPVRFDPQRDGSLQLTPVVTDRPLRLRGVAVPEKTYYRLDARLPAGGGLEWRLSDVVIPQGLGPDQLGLVALREGEPAVYVPLQAGGSGAVMMLIRPSRSATALWWRYAPQGSGGCGRMSKWRTAESRWGFDRGAPARVELPDELSGALCVEAQAAPREGGANLKSLWRIHLGP